MEAWQSRRASWVLAPALAWQLFIKLTRLALCYFCFVCYFIAAVELVVIYRVNYSVFELAVADSI